MLTKEMTKVHNFSAGPGILPAEVLKQAAEACINFDNLNLSLLEISHRSKNYEAVMEEARALVKELLGLNDNYKVLFLGGGASLQFAMVPYNLLRTEGTAGYVNTGVWASNSIISLKGIPFQPTWIIYTSLPTIPFMEHRSRNFRNHRFHWFVI